MEKLQNKKAIIALVLVAVLGVVGTTFAYFTSTDTFENVFSTKPYTMEVAETFVSPDDWTPGTTTSKSVIATNKGDIDAAVRVSYTESWVDSNGDPLPLKDNDNNEAAIINFANNWSNSWTKSTENSKDYYYYKTKLTKNQATSSLIDSVTFNSNVAISSEDNCVTSGNTKTCTTTTTGYAGGTYTLTISVETAQFDQYKNIWNTTVTIN